MNQYYYSFIHCLVREFTFIEQKFLNYNSLANYREKLWQKSERKMNNSTSSVHKT